MFCQEIYYAIRPYDTLYKIAQRYKVSEKEIIKKNPNINFNFLRVGQLIKICYKTKLSKKGLNVVNTFRLLWEQHGAWTRMVISSLIFNAPDKEFEIKRLLRNPKDFANVLRRYYGDVAANQFDELLTEHLVLAADFVNASLEGNTTLANDIEKQWYQNAIDIARFLSQINPYFKFEVWRKMMFEHLGFVKKEAVDILNKDYQESIDTYDAMETQILQMADMMAYGIMKQFNIT